MKKIIAEEDRRKIEMNNTICNAAWVDEQIAAQKDKKKNGSEIMAVVIGVILVGSLATIIDYYDNNEEKVNEIISVPGHVLAIAIYVVSSFISFIVNHIITILLIIIAFTLVKIYKKLNR
ncbi:hypothetical protein [uncultured Desulfosarcina sp.]|uniref:hypothetical protein n=1 Tax=uncultured Desulfosarcina sp. TaxID=218289 RepID=UPI0029C8785F|nr:hypothetical protein [uncultured Desulfosarcina sp.]